MSMKSREFGAYALVFSVAALAFTLLGAPGLTAATAAAPPPPSQPMPAPLPAVSYGLPSFADLAEKALPAVVSIEATTIGKAGDRQRGMPMNPFEFFFGNPHGGQGQEGQPQKEFRSDSGGSGFVVSPDGLVVTNNHVIEGATKVTVHLGDRDLVATVKGTDPATDLALLKVEADRPLAYLPLGDSDSLRVGEWIMVIGNPLMLDHSVTVGVVSAKGRTIGLSRDASFENFIQTDAAINRGNSGGPLLNVRGEVVGIATAMNFGAENIGFAVPVKTLKGVLDQLRDHGKVSRGYLGVNIQNLDFERAQAFGLKDKKGALVISVEADTPAGQAGLEHGDVILRVDQLTIDDTRTLINYVSSKAPGETVVLEVVRDGRTIEKRVKLGSRPGQEDATTSANESEREKGIEWLGLDYRDLTSSLRQMHSLPNDLRGVFIADVGASSPFADEGLAPGDVIGEVNGDPVTDSASFESAVKGLKSGAFLRLYVSRFDPRSGRSNSFFAVARVP